MLRIRRRTGAAVRVDEACGCACDSGCQASARRDHARTHAAAVLGAPR
ncbi:hypothetical protein [Actinocatenispora rupis]|nr:hypothetical protein [Actinocatenispora rupis]